MSRIVATAIFAGIVLSSPGVAQEIDDLEPGVDTSATADIQPGVDTRDVDAVSPTVDTSEVPRASTPRPANSAVDTLALDAAQITGNQELPQVLYIVPWKSSDLGDLVGRPVNTLLDEVLAPADREVFLRQIEYYDDLHGDAGQD